jgi:hypothetical protein
VDIRRLAFLADEAGDLLDLPLARFVARPDFDVVVTRNQAPARTIAPAESFVT